MGRGRDDFSGRIILAAILLFLIVFSTRAPVYDGERLFLPAFPLWASVVGIGFATVWERAGRWPGWRSRLGRGVLALGFLAQGYGVVHMEPFVLSYYNLLVGGLNGATRLGLEPTYWGDSVDGRLLDELARRARARRGGGVGADAASRSRAAITTVPLADLGLLVQDQEAWEQADWLIVYRRSAYWPKGLEAALADRTPVWINAREGTWLAGLWQRTPRISRSGVRRLVAALARSEPARTSREGQSKSERRRVAALQSANSPPPP